MQLGPQPKEEDREGGDRQIPAVLVAGGEGEMAREKEGVEAHLLVASGRVGMADGRVVGDEQNAAAEEIDGEGSLVRERWG